jgi:hypothetical protein
VATIDARRYRRFPVKCSVELSSASGLQTCEVEDLGAGGCRLHVLFPLQRQQSVRIRLRGDRGGLEPTGQATVVWSSRDPPYKVGLAFSEPLAEQAIKFIHATLGPVSLLTPQGG